MRFRNTLAGDQIKKIELASEFPRSAAKLRSSSHCNAVGTPGQSPSNAYWPVVRTRLSWSVKFHGWPQAIGHKDTGIASGTQTFVNPSYRKDGRHRVQSFAVRFFTSAKTNSWRLFELRGLHRNR